MKKKVKAKRKPAISVCDCMKAIEAQKAEIEVLYFRLDALRDRVERGPLREITLW